MRDRLDVDVVVEDDRARVVALEDRPQVDVLLPDPLDRAARTILTAEGGSSPSRFKHIILTAEGRYRRLTPRELERANGFPDDWTKSGMSEGQRAFCMGNALVIGVVERIGNVFAEVARETEGVNGKKDKGKEAAA